MPPPWVRWNCGAETELRQLTGIPEGETIRTEQPEIGSELLSLPADALYRRAMEIHAGIKQAEAAVRAREFHMEAEKAEKYPQLTLISRNASTRKCRAFSLG